MTINSDTVTFQFNWDADAPAWEYDLDGTVYSFDTLLEAMTDYNSKRFEQ